LHVTIYRDFAQRSSPRDTVSNEEYFSRAGSEDANVDAFGHSKSARSSRIHPQRLRDFTQAQYGYIEFTPFHAADKSTMQAALLGQLGHGEFAGEASFVVAIADLLQELETVAVPDS
jgi:hypothetical protein